MIESHPYYINQEGKIIEYDDLSSHAGIAARFIENDPEIQAEFKKSGKRLSTDFMVEDKGFIQVTDEMGNGYYRNKIVFSASKMSQKQKQMVMGYIAEGYSYENIDETFKESIVQRFHDFMDDHDF